MASQFESNSNDVSGSNVNPVNLEIEIETESVEVGNKRNRQLISSVWDYCTQLGVGSDGKKRAKCNACGKEYVCGGHGYGTSTLRRHIAACELTPKLHETDVGKLMLDHAGKLRARKVDQKVVRDMLAMSIIEHDLAFSFVEYRRIRELLKYLSPEVKIPSRRASTIDILNLYEGEKKKLKDVLSKVPSRISLTSDVWTACTAEGYISLTAHFVDENWKLNSKILNFRHFPALHTGQELAKVVHGFLVDWGIEGKFFSLTLDNAKSNDNMQISLKDKLLNNNGLLCGGEFFHVRCCAHILNLIVQDGLQNATESLSKIRQSIKYVRATEGRRIAFRAYVSKHGIDKISKVGLHLDVITRWNSTYLMLKTAISHRRAFKDLALDDSHYNLLPTDEEWERAEKICAILLPFYEITNLMSGSTYPTSNLYFMQVWTIQCLLVEYKANEDKVIRNMIEDMQEKFDKYWSDYSVVLALGTILDPRYKFQFMDFCYSDIGLNFEARQAKMNVVKHKLNTLFNEYVIANANTSFIGQTSNVETQSTQLSGDIASFHAPPTSVGATNSVLNRFITYENQQVSQVGKPELETYLDDAKLSSKYYPNLDLLQYWKEHQSRYPILALMASDILSIQITTVASESSFSIGSRVLNKYRSSLLPKNVEALICSRNWLLGFDVEGLGEQEDEEDEENNPRMGQPTTMGESSVV